MEKKYFELAKEFGKKWIEENIKFV